MEWCFLWLQIPYTYTKSSCKYFASININLGFMGHIDEWTKFSLHQKAGRVDLWDILMNGLNLACIKKQVGLWKSQSFRLILRSLPIPIKILKKDLDPGSLDPLVRSSNSLNLQHCASLALQAFLKFPQAQRWCMLGKHGSPWNGHHDHPEQPLSMQFFLKFTILGSPWSCPTPWRLWCLTSLRGSWLWRNTLKWRLS